MPPTVPPVAGSRYRVQVILASFPSPARGVWHVGPLPIRAYALCIILGVVAAVMLGERRWQARGGRHGTVTDIAALAVPFGLVGGRLYHVVTSPQLYFGKGGHPIEALYVWRGGLGIPGAILLGGVGAWIACRRRGIALPAFADAVGPGIAVAQGIGRWGNYFNQELFGRATTLPWAVRIDPGHDGYQAGHASYHPTFLYESLWDLGTAGLVIWADRRFRLGRGRAFALYIGSYAVGRAWIEALRADQANRILGLRVNEWVSLLGFAGAVLWIVTHRGPREETVEPLAVSPAEPPAAESDHPPPDHPPARPDEPADVPSTREHPT